MMKRPTPPRNLLAALIGLAGLAATGQAPLPPPPPPGPGVPPPPEAAPVRPEMPIPEGLTPANRDPFWPVGYVPGPKGAAVAAPSPALPQKPVSEPKWTEARKVLRVSGYMRTPTGFTALVNNTLASPGDTVSAVFEGKRYRWKIDSISAGGIAFTPLDWEPVESAK